jgi:hypothetical protein
MTPLATPRITVPLPALPRMVRPALTWTIAVLTGLLVGFMGAALAYRFVSNASWPLGLLGLAVPLAFNGWREARARRPRAVTVADGFAEFDGPGGARRVALASILRLERDRAGLVLVTQAGAERLSFAGPSEELVVQAISAGLGRPVTKDWRTEAGFDDPRPELGPIARFALLLDLLSVSFVSLALIGGHDWTRALVIVGPLGVLTHEGQRSRGVPLAAAWLSLGLGAVVAVTLDGGTWGADAMGLATVAALGAWVAACPWTAARHLGARTVGAVRWGLAPYPLPRSPWVVGLIGITLVCAILAAYLIVGRVTILAALSLGTVGVGVAAWARRGEPDAGHGWA